MNNFNICYNALCRAFDKENVIVPPGLVEILKPHNSVYSSVIHTNTNDAQADTTKSLTSSLSSLSITANANLLNLPLSELALTIKPNPLDLPHDQKQRQEIAYKLNQLVFGIRQQKLKTKKKETYELPPLIKQLIRCLYPSDIDDNNCSQKPDIVFTLRTFIELFRV
ncbi:unnamed protein product [Rotaria socialis]|uniref:Uncharacterized protein n=2 Tax=Rotaria socialis TaxID=392032 RepID=A0A817RNE9_9BILA|nr:unnamed protein product [Rotaria socialis]CAF3676640.1 unnamed protein product [Rotaria socialis]CAF4551991.1 unnamed protein product [Rotaria socialis]CAF4572821.1 unnamed protein product [Rotaria socialis]